MEANTVQAENVFQECFLPEFDIAERQLVALANAVPAAEYTWRPNGSTRCLSEIFLHIVAANCFILEMIGHTAPREIYPAICGEGEERIWQVIRRNDEFERSIQAKDRILEILKRSLEAVRASLSETETDQRAQPIIRRAYMRLLAHCHEHLGEMIAYVRTIGMDVPWEDSEGSS